QRLLDLLRRLCDLAARVGVLDPEPELAALVTREEPVEERRVDVPDVQEAGRARRHANDWVGLIHGFRSLTIGLGRPGRKGDTMYAQRRRGLAAIVCVGVMALVSAVGATGAKAPRLAGKFQTDLKVTYVKSLVGVAAGSHAVRTWTFTPKCASGSCTTVLN